MRTRSALLGAAMTAALVAAPAQASVPSVCNLLAADLGTRAMVPASGLRAARRLGARVVGGVPALGVAQVAFPSGEARDAALPLVRGLQPENAYRATRSPNDPYVAYQWGLYRIGAMKAWDRETGARNPVTVAVLDTGVDGAHPDLKGRVLAGRDHVSDDDDPSDDHGHGTAVAGVVVANANNKLGIAGMSWGAKVLAVKVLAANGEGSDCDIALGMVQAADAGARVLNLSLGSDGVECGVVTQAAVDYARDAGALVVAASGNSAEEGNPTNAPANCDGVLAVGATDSRDRVATFSTHHPYVGVSAPGVGVLSAKYDPRTGKRGYASWSGTSMATPFVSGLAALLLSRNPGWTPEQVHQRIVSTADDRGPRGHDEFYGAGRVNAARAVG